jgi:hypothetical protein
MDAGAEIVFASDSLLRQTPSGRITVATPLDDISSFSNGEYAVSQTGGINGTVNIISGVMTISNPGIGYTAGAATIGDDTPITISVINGYGLDTVCAANYIHRWEGGTLYITDPFPGQGIRVAQYKLTTPPDSYQDETLGYRVGSLYILDNGDKYICTDATATAATWVQVGPEINPGVAYVQTNGNNTTGTIGDPSKPYLTAQAAFDAGARIFVIGVGVTTSVSVFAYGTDDISIALFVTGCGLTDSNFSVIAETELGNVDLRVRSNFTCQFGQVWGNSANGATCYVEVFAAVVTSFDSQCPDGTATAKAAFSEVGIDLSGLLATSSIMSRIGNTSHP